MAPRMTRRRGPAPLWLLLATALTVTLCLPVAGQASAASAQRDVVVRSFDGTPISAHFFRADGLRPGARAPAVMLAHGYGEKAPAARDESLLGAPNLDALLRAGYNVLTWDARGHGSSGGQAEFDSPDYEVRDTRMLIDWLSRQPEVLLDKPGDPRVAMTGASYGGLIQFLTAAVDSRVDVISPAYTGHSLPSMIAPYGRFKETWAAVLAASGALTLPPGVLSPSGPHLHTMTPEALAGFTSGIATGELSPSFRSYLAYRSPSRFVGQVQVPTLLQQGTTDGLFPLGHAERSYRTLRSNGVPVKMVWNCEGHSLCGRDAGPAGRFTATAIRWFDRWLKHDPSVRTGAGFEWIADNEGRYRSAPSYPPARAGTLRATGSGRLAVTPLAPATSPGMVGYGGTPSSDAVDVDLPPPSGSVDVIGHPRVTISYRGHARPGKAYLYAQVVDVALNRVVGGQVTPIPVTLDGRTRTLTQDLEAIATRAGPTSRYRVQVFAGSAVYGAQRSTGIVHLDQITASVPVSRSGR